jgi:NO-binding membrane sensor protein with MHYT domain
MSPFETRLVIAAVLACAAIILAFVFRKNLRSQGGEYAAVFAVIVAIVGMPVLARALESLF